MPPHETGSDVAVVVPPPGATDRYAAANDAAAGEGAEWLCFPAKGSGGPAAAPVPPAGGVDAVAGPDGTLAVRRRWFESLGGFAEGVLAGAEADLVLRLAAAGRPVDGTPEVTGAAARWIARAHPEAAPAPRLRDAWRRLVADNRVPECRRRPGRARGPALVVFTDAYPARSETFVAAEVAALRAAGWSVRVESSARPTRAERAALRAGRLDYLEDDPPARALADLLALVLRHPLRCLADARARRRWRREEEAWPLRALAPAARRLAAGGERHIHVHFAGLAALHAMRIARIAGVTYSVAPHGYDVFARPRNLAEKLSGAAFVAAPSEYTAAEIRRLLPAERRAGVHVIVMGVDGDAFRRRRPYPGGRTVAAIGRLVEKKGFGNLVEATRLLGDAGPDRVLIAGDGPLRGELERAIEAASLSGRVAIVDAWGAAPIRDLLEGADLLAMPCVIAADGDRDAMPVVVKEALAMEIPVVASNEVGLPELVEADWGRLVAPGDPQALAAAIEELLALAPERRAAMGAAGRAHVLAHCDVRAETAKLAELVEAAVSRRRGSAAR
jgi:glycosyltransferase involved in cell wall biosynthesis